ncbi:OmpA family protein [Sphingobium sp.]|uniref:OmpA family protein n=1 Tax=Sphingobium sp. TaxID=1912891 RepID=UPI0028BDEF28|nr:OmpA family protein [Sphingobium sp.]
MALTVLPITVATAANPVFLPDIAPLSAFPDPSHATRREGVFLPPETVRLLTPGMTRRQVYALLGAPHFHEGFFGVRRWNYILNFYTGSGTTYRICRLQLRWDRRTRLEGVAWSAEDCRAAVWPVAGKVEVAAPLPQPAPPFQSPPIPSASIYFDFARADLGEAARRTLMAFAASVAGSGRSLSIIGYTDSAGPDAYNDRLSLMRADAVARNLVLLGVPVARLQISGAGERSPALKTADGLAEPLNRRTVVTIMSN